MFRAPKSFAVATLAALLALVPCLPANAETAAVHRWDGARDSSPSGATCEDYLFSVTENPGAADRHQVFGRLCHRGPVNGKTMQILLHGATYDHKYWDFPYRPDSYSYVRKATEAGYTTLDIDRLGYGYSSVVNPITNTVPVQGWTIHQIVQAVRSGALGAQFPKIIEVGHSVGSYVTWQEAGTYHDVDGVIITGDEHVLGPRFAVAGAALSEPTQIDPKWRSANLPPGYLTTFPGARQLAFFDQSNVDPEVVELDEQLKGTWPAGELETAATSVANIFTTESIKVPVLVADGDNDYFCSLSCSMPLSAAHLEQAFYLSTPCYQLAIVPNAGHDINLQRNATTFYDTATQWANRRIGNGTATPTAPCARK